MEKIIKNAAQCRKCGDYLESTHVHDFKRCTCGAIAVDGGREYVKWCGELEDIIDLCEIEEDGATNETKK